MEIVRNVALERTPVFQQKPPSEARAIRVVFETNDTLHYNTTKAARKLGMSRQHLTELAAKKIDGKPTVYAPSGKFGKDNIYHAYQLKLISLVMRGKLTLEHASDVWRSFEHNEVKEAQICLQGGQDA